MSMEPVYSDLYPTKPISSKVQSLSTPIEDMPRPHVRPKPSAQLLQAWGIKPKPLDPSDATTTATTTKPRGDGNLGDVTQRHQQNQVNYDANCGGYVRVDDNSIRYEGPVRGIPNPRNLNVDVKENTAKLSSTGDDGAYGWQDTTDTGCEAMEGEIRSSGGRPRRHSYTDRFDGTEIGIDPELINCPAPRPGFWDESPRAGFSGYNPTELDPRLRKRKYPDF